MLSIVVITLLIQQFYLTDQLETIQATVSSTVELACSITKQNIESTNSAKIVWIRDDQADIVSLDSIITVRDQRLSILPMDSIDRQERILRITNVDEQDGGLYRCIQGDLTLSEILLDILVPPRIVSHSPEHMRMTVREGNDAQFSCTATGHPTPSIIWHVNGLLVSDTVTIADVRNESTLILRNVSRHDSGRVDCSASNVLSTVNRQFLLTVKYKPLVIIPPQRFHYVLPDTATIICQVCSIPPTTVFDFFRPKQSAPTMNGVKEKFDKFINQTCRQLTITFHLNDASLFGPYVCRARNSLGVNHAEFILKEMIKPTKHMKHVTEYRPSLPSPPTTFMFDTVNDSLTHDDHSSIIANMTRDVQSQSYQPSISVLLLLISLFTMV